jgi:hypothetical protein
MKINKNNENSNNNASFCRMQLCELSGVAETNEQYQIYTIRKTKKLLADN